MWKIWKQGEKTKKKRIHKYESEKVNKMNNIYKLNVDDQQDDIKH